MSTHNIAFHGEVGKIEILFGCKKKKKKKKKSTLFGAMYLARIVLTWGLSKVYL